MYGPKSQQGMPRLWTVSPYPGQEIHENSMRMAAFEMTVYLW